MERYILDRAIEKDKSVLGICRGVQFMNACYGGTLYQDLEREYNSSIYHILKKEQMGVNSYHHQAVKTLSKKKKKTAISEDGLIEGIYMPSRKFIMGVQWHPEFSYEVDENSRKIIHAFVRSI